MTIKEIYRQSIKLLKEKGIPSAELDARILICAALNITLDKYIATQNDSLSPAQIKKINSMIKKRTQNIPVAYILGKKDFYGLEFKVNKDVLIPRPESERLVELALARLTVNRKPLTVLDIGTGSGNIIISIAKSLSPSTLHLSPVFFASDISSAALRVAKVNAIKHNVDKKIKFIKSDLFSSPKLNQKFDIIIANLPYVPKTDKYEKSIMYEPKDAIFAAGNGAAIIKRFLKSAPKHLNENGTIFIELDPRNAIELKKTAHKYFPNSKIELQKDLANFYRYLIIEN